MEIFVTPLALLAGWFLAQQRRGVALVVGGIMIVSGIALSALEQQRNGAFAVYQTFLVCRQHALQLFTELYGEQDAQQALSPLLLGISNLTVTVGREITDAKSPHGTLQVSYTNATTVSEVIEAHTGYAVTTIPKRSST